MRAIKFVTTIASLIAAATLCLAGSGENFGSTIVLTINADPVTNGAFGSAAGWTFDTNWNVSAGQAVSTGGTGYLQQDIGALSPVQRDPKRAFSTYRLVYTVVSNVLTNATLSGSIGNSWTQTLDNSVGTFTNEFEARGTNDLVIQSATTGGVSIVALDNVSVVDLTARRYTVGDLSVTGGQPALRPTKFVNLWFMYDMTGTYTVNVDVVLQDVRFPLLRGSDATISAGRTLGWLDNSIWLTGDRSSRDYIELLPSNISRTNTADARIQLEQ